MGKVTWKEDDQKFKELVLYISQQCATHLTFGATKLNKVLFYSDFLAYAYHAKPITGHEYQKLINGPAPRKLPILRAQMIKEGSLGIQPVRLKNGHTQQRPINLREPKLNIFTGDQIAIVDMVIAGLADATAEETSWMSHQLVGWLAAEKGETIPYGSILISNEPLTDSEIERGREIAARFATS
jgi:hypothetical protein